MRHGSTPLIAALSLALLAASTAAFAGEDDKEPPLPDSRLGVQTAPLLLITRPDVRDDLALDDAQFQSARKAIREVYVEAAALKGQRGPEAVARRRAVDQKMQRWIDETLSVEQRSRLVQIELQWEGPAALHTRPVVAETLSLTKDQRDTIATAVARRAAGRDGERDLAKTVLGCLSPEQRETWGQMLGRPFQPRLAETPRPRK